VEQTVFILIILLLISLIVSDCAIFISPILCNFTKLWSCGLQADSVFIRKYCNSLGKLDKRLPVTVGESKSSALCELRRDPISQRGLEVTVVQA
jgi:hypothetical protein